MQLKVKVWPEAALYNLLDCPQTEKTQTLQNPVCYRINRIFAPCSFQSLRYANSPPASYLSSRHERGFNPFI